MMGTRNSKTERPAWWPQNPYPKDIFVMPQEKYEEIVPDPDLRTGLSGMLGRIFWDIAETSIWERIVNMAMEEENNEVLRFLGLRQ